MAGLIPDFGDAPPTQAAMPPPNFQGYPGYGYPGYYQQQPPPGFPGYDQLAGGYLDSAVAVPGAYNRSISTESRSRDAGGEYFTEYSNEHYSINEISTKLKEDVYNIKSYFPLRRNCRMTLYNDAHNGDDAPPAILEEATGKAGPYKPADCWDDVFESMCQAKKFLFITGWSVYTEIKLLRRVGERFSKDPFYKPYINLTLGELLKKKAEEGVRVALLLWDDKTNNSAAGYFSSGLMSTHDEVTKGYFAGSKVICELAVRAAVLNDTVNVGVLSITNHLMKVDLTNEFIWTHHQKSVICDAPLPNSQGHQRRIVAFVGGLDLTDGRWDTPKHSLFRTMKNEHLPPDFYQNCTPINAEWGPREPWHDIHAKVEGEVAYDVMKNFTERMAHQYSHYYGKKADAFEIFEKDRDLIRDNFQEQDSFNVQLFRSIDGQSALKGAGVEKSIHSAYVHVINAANRFIYIENQYFLSNSPQFPADVTECPVKNTIAKAITDKIVTCINEGVPFAAYILLPMFPEGNPAEGPPQMILCWQFYTIKGMYKAIADALKKPNEKNQKLIQQRPHPCDWLNFFCLGNRETLSGDVPKTEPPLPPTVAATAAEFNTYNLFMIRRHPIYVHSKMMIVDDDYIFIGSANINDRSMRGDRDTELCLGAYQPLHLSDGRQIPRGQIHKFRLSLWAEHLNCSEAIFSDPATFECVNRVRQLSDNNWAEYVSNKKGGVEISGHLLTYPYGVHKDGTLYRDPLYFPDTTAPIIGTFSGNLPILMTT